MVTKETPWVDLVENLTINQVIDLMESLGSSKPIEDKEGNLVFQSICHNSNSKKLCYYVKTKTFFCYKEWESFSIFTLVMRVKNFTFKEAFLYICETINYDYRKNMGTKKGFFNSNNTKEDWNIFQKYYVYEEKEEKELPAYFDEKVIDLYSKIYYEGWIEEHISPNSMEKYDIRYDVANNRIIIPHYDINRRLVGIRCRNLDENATAKYCPIEIEGNWYSHSLSKHLYGLDKNKLLIKKLGKVVIVESEKSVQQAETYFPENNFVVACCGSNIGFAQINLLLNLGIKEVQLAFDYDFHEIGNNLEYLKYRLKILRLAKKLVPYFTVYNISAFNEETTAYKYSPTDFSKELLLQMMKNKILITYNEIEKIPELERKINSLERKLNGQQYRQNKNCI